MVNCLELAQDRDHWRTLVNELVNIPISSQLCYVTMATIWKNTEHTVHWRTALRCILKIGVDMMNWVELFQDKEIIGEYLLIWH